MNHRPHCAPMPRAASTRKRERTIAELVARYERQGTIVRDALDAAARVVDDDAGAEEVVEATREATREATARRREDAREARERDEGRATVTVTCPKCGRGLGARRFAWHLERCLRANAA